MWSLCRPALYGMSNAGRGALAVCDEPRSQDPCKPFLIGGHSWGSEHLKLFYTQQNRIEAALAPGTWPPRTSVRRRCQLAHCLLPRSFQNSAVSREHAPGLLMSIDAHQADADAAAACSLGSSSLSASQPTHTPCLYLSHLPSLSFCTLHLHIAPHRVVHGTLRWAYQGSTHTESRFSS